MPHFAEEPFTDDPEQLEALYRLLHGAQPGVRPEPPSLESRFGVRASPRAAAGRARRSERRPGLLTCRNSGAA